MSGLRAQFLSLFAWVSPGIAGAAAVVAAAQAIEAAWEAARVLVAVAVDVAEASRIVLVVVGMVPIWYCWWKGAGCQ